MASAEPQVSWEIVRLKAELLCLGLHATPAARTLFSIQNPCGDWKTGNVGLHLRLPGSSHVLVTMSHTFDRRSPYSLHADGGTIILHKGDNPVSPVEPVQMPHWYSQKTSTGSPMASHFLHEGRAYLHQAYTGCDFHRDNVGCQFCGTGSEWRIGTPLEVAETVDAALR
jgi:hypothetical protein